MVSAKVGGLIALLIFAGFLLVGGKDAIDRARPNISKFKNELTSGISERTKNVRDKSNGGTSG